MTRLSRPAVPAAVKRALRLEVGLGCPIQGCRSAVLQYHHFDPPWAEIAQACEARGALPTVDDHRAGGMIALCPAHHGYANGDVYSRKQLRQLKSASYTHESVRQAFPWENSSILTRFGGNYSPGVGNVFNVGGIPVLQFTRDEHDLIQFTTRLHDRDGNIVLEVLENSLETDSARVHDLTVNSSATHVSMWLAEREVGFEVRFGRLTAQEIGDVVHADSDRARSAVKRRLLDDLDEHAPEEWRSSLLESLENPSSAAAERLLSWSDARADGEGRLAMLDVRRLVTHTPSGRVVINDGLATQGLQIAFNWFEGNRRGAISL